MSRNLMVGSRMKEEEVDALDRQVAALQQRTPGRVTRSDLLRYYAVEGLRRDGLTVGKVPLESL